MTVLVSTTLAVHIVDKLPPGGAPRQPRQLQPSLLRASRAFAAIARMARAHHVFPTRQPVLRAWNDMVQVQIITQELVAAILAGIAVAAVDIESTETDLPPRHTVIGQQQNDPWHAHDAVHQPNSVVVDRGRQVEPAVEVEGAVLSIDSVRNSLI